MMHVLSTSSLISRLPSLCHLLLDRLGGTCVILFGPLQDIQTRFLVPSVMELISDCDRKTRVSVSTSQLDVGTQYLYSHAAMAIQAVNMLGGVHWLQSPMPQTFLTTSWIRSCGLRGNQSLVSRDTFTSSQG